MSKTFAIKERGNPNAEVKHLDWQNASELVSHGRFEWASGGSGAEEFATAKKQAKVTNTKPDGFEHLEEVKESSDDDDDERGGSAPAPAPAPKVTVETVAQTKTEEKDPLAEMTREELYAEAVKRELDPDKRLGTKSLLTMIREDKVKKGEK